MSPRFDNVFVLNTGRCGSLTFHHACKHIENYSSAHETVNDTKHAHAAPYTLPWPRHHIEIDNRLAWFLGVLERDFGSRPYYVHLTRERDATARSLAKRRGIFQSFATTMMHRPFHAFDDMSDDDKLEIAGFFFDVVTANIEMFLDDKPDKIRIPIEGPEAGFREFWAGIGATGDMDAALAEFSRRYHAS